MPKKRDVLESLRKLIDEFGLSDALKEIVEEDLRSPKWNEEIVPETLAKHWQELCDKGLRTQDENSSRE